MGSTESTLSEAELDELQHSTNFTPTEIRRLYKRFRKLDKDDSGAITTDEFMMIPELSMNPLAPRTIALFDTDHDDAVNFKEFIEALSVFSVRGAKREKLQFAFKIYDLDKDGYISNKDLFLVVKTMVGSNLTEVQLQQIVDKTILEADLDGDGKISFDEFCKVLEATDLAAKLSIKL
ncbi:Calcineurin B protein like protein [Aduncisulcus paluster]|uniref:Calcineurin B protein like protein n=1 Tax=Aduncisulcus paluster TaxID=2918883 RepID=A0ABQ5KQ03_9EUKA|nr:Calcineurin B protein like protein [Aduncisulcus paluster]